MTRTLGEPYFRWLVSQIDTGNTSKTYEGIFRWMYHREFVWLVPNDDNRIGDAIDLRKEFWGEGRLIPQEGAVILEVLVALSRRAAWIISDIEAPKWAWKFIKNLGLNKYNDPLTYRKDAKIEDILERFVWRTYEANGEGGLFPLEYTKHDQRKVEIWYQMHAYINEKIPI